MEIYLLEDGGWYYRDENSVEWGPFESYDEAEMMSLTPETIYQAEPGESEVEALVRKGNSSTGNVTGSV